MTLAALLAGFDRRLPSDLVFVSKFEKRLPYLFRARLWIVQAGVDYPERAVIFASKT